MIRIGRLIVLLVVVVVLAMAAWVFRGPLRATWQSVTGTAAGAPMSTGSMASADASPAGTSTRGDVTIDPRRQQLMDVRTVVASRKAMTPDIRAVGTVQYDETHVADINVKVEGWIRDLQADYTGQPITAGQPLFTLYSPDLLAAEQEYIVALNARDRLQSSAIADATARADALVAASRRRLTLLDLPDADLRALDETRQPKDAVQFRAPIAGIVTDKTAVRGLHVTPGQTLYRVADLSTVWVEADVYETDLAQVHAGDRAAVSFDAYPRDHFSGRVLYINPSVGADTRTTKVRVALPNPDGRLKPGMYAQVVMTGGGGMGILVPSDAVLDSGTEQLVFVSDGNGHFQPRPVTIGRRLGSEVQIAQGLKDGEVVASGANFFLDSESQLRAALPSFSAAPGSPASTAANEVLQITLRTTPDPATTGENQFEATVKDAQGAPVADAQVTVQLFMAAMPTMNMPAMRNEVPLTAAGAGAYRGTGQVMMAGRWDATVTVTRGGQRLGSKQLPVVAR
jgi:Cu(I)/Ag(I) efflux system membrane fusion protein/cobalt-zinc-cadmium efflux system membrane fusion protein